MHAFPQAEIERVTASTTSMSHTQAAGVRNSRSNAPAAPEESEDVVKRFRRSEEAQTSTPEETASCEGCGCGFVKTRRSQRFHSRKCGQRARDRKRWSKRRNCCITGAALEQYRSNPQSEQAYGDSFVICRECGRPYQALYSHIPDVHKITGNEYRRKWPGAPLATENVRAVERERQRKRLAAEDPEKKKERLARGRNQQRLFRATHVEELKQKRREHRALNRDAINKRKREWCAAHRDEKNRRQREQHAANRDERNARQRAARAADAERFREYAQKSYANHQTQRLRYAAKRRQVAWRPSDWTNKPIEWRIIGTELLVHDYISNEELGALLDASRILTCPKKYGERWGAALSPDKGTNSKAATELVRQIRLWVRKPGRRGNAAA